MNLEEVKQIVELFSKSNVDLLELDDKQGMSLKLSKRKEKVIMASMPEAAMAAAPSAPAVAAPANTSTEEDAGEEAGLVYLNSPIVGTFYRSPSPDAAPFAKVGDRVSKGQTLCIVEAMKLMNEIPSEIDGEIVKIHVEDAQGVEFGQKLFAIRAS